MVCLCFYQIWLVGHAWSKHLKYYFAQYIKENHSNMHMHACSPHVQGSNFPFAGEIVTGGLANFTASWSSNSMVPPVTLVSQSLNLCDIVKKFDVSCPVQSGYYYRNYTNSISLILPAVSHIVHTHTPCNWGDRSMHGVNKWMVFEICSASLSIHFCSQME